MKGITFLGLLLILTTCAAPGQTTETQYVLPEMPTRPSVQTSVARLNPKATATIQASPVMPTDTSRPSPAPPTETPIPSLAPLTKAAIASCPVSLPNVSTRLNKFKNADGTLTTDLWPGGKVIFQPGGPGSILPDGSLAMKWPWDRKIPGEVTIGGRRLDAPAPPMPTVILRGIPDGYGETGFHASGLLFPSEGCWEVTAKVGDASLTFVTLVVKVPFRPARPARVPEGLMRRDTDLTDLPQSIRLIYGPRDGGAGELIVETTQGVRENRAPYPETAIQPVTVHGQPAICVRGTWDEQNQWQAEADAGILAWTAEGFNYRITHRGLGLRCEDLLRIAGSPRRTP